MKKQLATTLLALLLSISGFTSENSNEASKPEDFQIVSIYDLNDDTEPEIEDLSLFVVEFPKDAKINLRGILSGDFLELSSENDQLGMITVKQPFYCRIVDDNIVASSNLVDWQSFSDFLTGQLNVSADADVDGPCIEIKIDLNKKN